jgi:putative sterol carrier protein
MDEYVKALNENKDYAEGGKGWGVDFNGNWLWVLEGFPIDKIDLEKLPEDYRKELQEHVVGGNVYVFVEQKDGKCLGYSIPKSPEEVKDAEAKAGFKLSGAYDPHWKALGKGEADATRLVMTGKMKLVGDMSKVMRWIKMVTVMPKIAAAVPKEVVDEKYPKG